MARSAQLRPEFIAEACEDDEDLRKEIESLISAHESSDDLIERPAADIAAELLAVGEGGLITGQILAPWFCRL